MKLLKLLLFKEDDTPMRIRWGVLTNCWCGYTAQKSFLLWDHFGIASSALHRSHLVARHGYDPHKKR